MEVALIRTVAKREIIKVALWALLPVIVWGSAMIVIKGVFGIHSTPGIWGAIVGFPGVAVGGFLEYVTRLQITFYIGLLFGNWLFWFIVFRIAFALKNKVA
jgi:hypothetical protein